MQISPPVRHLKNINPGLEHSYFSKDSTNCMKLEQQDQDSHQFQQHNISGLFLDHLFFVLILWWDLPLIYRVMTRFAGHAEQTATRLLSDD